MLKGDCNECIFGGLPENSEVCVECGISRKNYTPIKAECGISRKNYEEETRTMRVLTAADLKTANTLALTAVKERLDRLCLETDTIATAAYGGAMIGIDEYIKILAGMLTEKGDNNG